MEAQGIQTLFSQVAHDLKAPLFSFAAVGRRLLEKETGLLPQHRELLKAAVDGLITLSNQVDNQLDQERFRQGRLRARVKEVEFHILVEELMEPLRPFAALKGVALCNRVLPGTHFATDREMAHAILSNLVQNALQACRIGDYVIVNSDLDDGVLLVEDSGPGLKQQDWDRLIRGQMAAPNSSGTGHGLGLKYCNELLKMLGGYLEHLEGVSSGTTIRVHLTAQKEGRHAWDCDGPAPASVLSYGKPGPSLLAAL